MNTYEKIPTYEEKIAQKLTSILHSGAEIRPERIKGRHSRLFFRSLALDNKGYHITSTYIGPLSPAVNIFFGKTTPIMETDLPKVVEKFHINENDVYELQLALGLTQRTLEEITSFGEGIQEIIKDIENVSR